MSEETKTKEVKINSKPITKTELVETENILSLPNLPPKTKPVAKPTIATKAQTTKPMITAKPAAKTKPVAKPTIATKAQTTKPITKPISKTITTTRSVTEPITIIKPTAKQNIESAPKGIIREKPKYGSLERQTISEIIGGLIRREFLPTQKIGSILGFIFLAILILALFQFPLAEFLSGQQTNMKVEIGYPQVFLVLGTDEEAKNPLKIKGFILDMILYIILAYIIDILLKLIVKSSFFKSGNSPEKPILFKSKQTIADKITKKIIS